MSDVVVAEYLDGGPGESDPEHDGGVVLLVAQHQGPLGEQPREVLEPNSKENNLA